MPTYAEYLKLDGLLTLQQGSQRGDLLVYRGQLHLIASYSLGFMELAAHLPVSGPQGGPILGSAHMGIESWALRDVGGREQSLQTLRTLGAGSLGFREENVRSLARVGGS